MENETKRNNHFKLLSREDVLKYCAGWDIPTADTYSGFYLLIAGWLGVFLGGMVAWFATPFGFFGFVFAYRAKYSLALKCEIAAMIIGLQSYFMREIPLNEGGTMLKIDHLGSGFYLWELSFLLTCIYCYLGLSKNRLSADRN